MQALDRLRDRFRGPSWLVFAVFSVSAHAGAFGLVAAKKAATPQLEFRPTTESLAGETLDVEPAQVPEDVVSADEAEPAPSPQLPGTGAPSLRHPVAHGSHFDRAAGTNEAATAAPAPAVFGAVGVRFATDLATTFTRAFPQAASADPIWSTASIGSAGTAEVLLRLDDEGHLVGSDIRGAPSAALRRGIERTVALLRQRAFTAMRPATRLRVTARVGRDDVHDGFHGDVFALSGGSFSGDTGTAFFALPGAGGGRRIDVELRLLP